MDNIKQHLPHLIAIAPATGVVMHTYQSLGSLGFEPVALSVAISASLAAGVWAAWSHVFAPRVPELVRVIGLSGALVLSGAEGYLMYQHKGDLPDPAYQSAMANYTLQHDRYTQGLADWQDNQRALVASIKAQQQEIIDNDKLTSRRVDMERLTGELAKATKEQPPVFGLAKPVETKVVNKPWLAFTVGLVALTPVLYGMLHLFGFRRPKEPVAPPAPVIEVAPVVAPIAKHKPTILDMLAIDRLEVGSVFNCPICGEEATKARKDKVTCGKPACRVAVSRLRDKSANVLTLKRVA